MAFEDIWQRLMKDDTEKFLRQMAGQDKKPAPPEPSRQDEEAPAPRGTGPFGGGG